MVLKSGFVYQGLSKKYDVQRLIGPYMPPPAEGNKKKIAVPSTQNEPEPYESFLAWMVDPGTVWLPWSLNRGLSVIPALQMHEAPRSYLAHPKAGVLCQ